MVKVRRQSSRRYDQFHMNASEEKINNFRRSFLFFLHRQENHISLLLLLLFHDL